MDIESVNKGVSTVFKTIDELFERATDPRSWIYVLLLVVHWDMTLMLATGSGVFHRPFDLGTHDASVVGLLSLAAWLFFMSVVVGASMYFVSQLGLLVPDRLVLAASPEQPDSKYFYENWIFAPRFGAEAIRTQAPLALEVHSALRKRLRLRDDFNRGCFALLLAGAFDFYLGARLGLTPMTTTIAALVQRLLPDGMGTAVVVGFLLLLGHYGVLKGCYVLLPHPEDEYLPRKYLPEAHGG